MTRIEKKIIQIRGIKYSEGFESDWIVVIHLTGEQVRFDAFY